MPNPLTYGELVTKVSGSNYKIAEILGRLDSAVIAGEITPAQYSDYMEQFTGYRARPIYSKVGQRIGYQYVTTETATTANTVNSNATTINRGVTKTPITTTVEAGTNVVRSGRILPPSGFPSTYSYVMNSIAAPIAAVATGITLGKALDSALYNAFPDFFDSNGMSSFNPETWNSITQGLDYTDPVTGVSASLLNMILGLNPETGEGQAYIDENAFAYLAYCMNGMGVFNKGDSSIDEETVSSVGLNTPINITKLEINSPSDWSEHPYKCNFPIYSYTANSRLILVYLYSDSPITIYATNYNDNRLQYIDMVASDGARATIYNRGYYAETGSAYSSGTYSLSNQYIYNSIPVYYFNYLLSFTNAQALVASSNAANMQINDYGGKTAWSIVNGDIIETPAIDGISDQTGATIPDFNGLAESEYLPYLQQTYPNIFDNAIDYPVVQDDGTVVNHKYIPVTMPNMGTSPYTQPVSGGNTQSNTAIDPATDTAFADLIAKLFQQPETDPLNPDYKPPENPTDTGEGSTPAPLAPTGSASALWAIYHPTQAQIDSFGAWLWSSDFIDQILKIFNNPMDSIIGLHKVYATPIDAGTTTIQVGYLDSEVPSAYITQQYVNIDCGFVDLSEQFGNVFDYSPFTTCKLYLPFIGIVNLDVSEVMRSTVSVSYGVDVLTGACLARVNIERDGNSNVLYQFAGNCAVQYPLSMGSYMGIVSSIIGVAGSIAATVASGGSVAPLAIGAAGAALGAHTSVQNSGSFSGNAGAMGGKIPYLIIERPQTRVIGEQFQFTGIPTNEYQALGNFDGFVKCSDSHLLDVPATDEELTEISSLLSSGVIV